MSDSYSSIAENYDYIFPLNPLQKMFLTSRIPSGKNISVLDLGCGTGSLAIALAEEEDYNIVGIDNDPNMIDVAQSKVKGKNPVFLVEDMTKVQRSFKAESFDAIYSFGNSLVHLSNPDDIENLFQTAKTLLKPGGKFLGQIINYRRIFDKMVTGLPTIDNEHISFERGYQFTGPGEPLYFKTRLLTKKDGKILENKEVLYPLLPEEALFFLENAGFYDIDLYGAFNGDGLLSDSYSFIFVAR
ncbi:class I SAM-dependent methyltransferase [Acetobacteroides hydrogenigenes]|uniref:Methyltransferase family protein n=1 Tax=Acetobacteroides hydrogenigenes TaxID=979970 RepID=A0A4R2EW54_9BACT|nr:class I SAM-dependent methyltransferase [Acetobacteroides hydrogenigenes]TCN73272.1 methyltransferase family protein [Acetobacteroides hydrogenigenes]